MLAIEVEFLMGRAVATEWQERVAAEWPPHPQRLFSALVSTHFDLQLGLAGEAALKWLESLPSPEICATITPSRRTVRSHWVPINDETIKSEKGKTDPRHPLERRNRQERWFPAMVLDDPIAVFQWPHAAGVELHSAALRAMVEHLSYLGHSSSPVRACLRTDLVQPTYRPAEEGDYVLRVPGPGRFDRLNAVHELRTHNESVQPPLGRVQNYTTAESIPGSLFSPDAIVLAFEKGPRLGIDATLPVMQHLRTAMLARMGDTATAVLTGHTHVGGISPAPHLAFLPLAHVTGRFADASMKGAALVLPRVADDLSRGHLLRSSLGRWDLHLGPLGKLSLRMLDEPHPDLLSLRFSSYTRPSKCWASVTPVVLDRHPKNNGPTTEDIIAESCLRIGLPTPAEVRFGTASAVLGVPRVADFHGRAKQTNGRARCHVWLRFDRSVRGPVVVGAGRFLGLGFCIPVAQADAA